MQSVRGESSEEAGYSTGVPNTSSTEPELSSEDEVRLSENSCDERLDYDENDWNTDDEVEEANANDDMMKMIEGDW